MSRQLPSSDLSRSSAPPQVFRYLHDAGYEVFWRGKNDNMDNTSLAHSTASMATWSGGDGNYGANPYALDDPRYYSFLWTAPPSNETTDLDNVLAAIDFLRARNASRSRSRLAAAAAPDADDDGAEQPPFMVFLPLSFPHPPYSCPEPWYSMYDPDDIDPLARRPIGDTAARKPDYHAALRNYTGQDQLNATDADRLYREVERVGGSRVPSGWSCDGAPRELLNRASSQPRSGVLRVRVATRGGVGVSVCYAKRH